MPVTLLSQVRFQPATMQEYIFLRFELWGCSPFTLLLHFSGTMATPLCLFGGPRGNELYVKRPLVFVENRARITLCQERRHRALLFPRALTLQNVARARPTFLVWQLNELVKTLAISGGQNIHHFFAAAFFCRQLRNKR